MSEKLDRRIAVEVMGEEEPPQHAAVFKYYGSTVVPQYRSENWVAVRRGGNDIQWEPKPFSSVLEEALRAVDKRLAAWRKEYLLWPGKPMLVMEYHPEDPEGITFGASFGTERNPGTGTRGYGQTLPEAICNLLLALKEKA